MAVQIYLRRFPEFIFARTSWFFKKYKADLEIESDIVIGKPSVAQTLTIRISDIASSYSAIKNNMESRTIKKLGDYIKTITLNNGRLNIDDHRKILTSYYRELHEIISEKMSYLGMTIETFDVTFPDSKETSTAILMTEPWFSKYFSSLILQFRTHGLGTEEDEEILKFIEKFLRLLPYIADKKEYIPKARSWLVFAGFGADELFPHAQRLGFSIDIEGRVRCSRLKKAITSTDTAILLPYGSTKVIDSLINGISPQYVDNFTQALHSRPLPASLDGLDQGAVADYLSSLCADVGDTLKKNFQKKILSAISQLPKHVMADIAENFVKIAAIQSHISDFDASVGGSVSTAVVTKGDGFVWVNRQSYFDASKNPQFGARSNPDRDKKFV